MLEKFIESIQRDVGGSPSPSEIIPGKIIRFATSDRQGDDAGWCMLFADGEGGVYGCWRQGISGTWQARTPETPEEQKAFLVRVKQGREEAYRLDLDRRSECQKRSKEIWDSTTQVVTHPYLETKNVKAYGLKQYQDTLILQVRDTEGKLHGLQFIGHDGEKRFKSGTSLTGNYKAIGKPNGKILVAEGYATAATLHEITGHAVAVAFTGWNLQPVAMALKAKHPDTQFIICADDDHATEGNPGITKATEAAWAVNGLLAVPTFPDTRGPKDTDFNDLARLSGPEAVRICIEAAYIPPPPSTIEKPVQDECGRKESEPEVTESLEEAVTRLAALPRLQYELVRKAEAKKLKINRVSELDKAVASARGQKETEDKSMFPEVDPWPEPVDPAALLSDIATMIRRFIICDKEVSLAVALWVAMTWFIDVVQVAPLAVITAPEKRCGKSLLLTLLGKLSARAITSCSISPAALFRTIDKWNPTLLIDEADVCLKGSEELRGLLDGGHTRDSAYTVRCEGDDHEPKKFITWGAKALASIGHVADTLMDRGIVLELRRKLPSEKVAKIRHAEPGLFDDLRSKLARFADDYSEQVQEARPPLPDSLNDRAQDNWEPLLAIAMVAGGDCLKNGTAAALKLSGCESASQTVGTELLADIKEIFEEKNVDRICTADLIKALCADKEKPWATYNKGLPITPRQLAKKLGGYDIHSKNIRIGTYDTLKGYEQHQFEDAFFRYAPPPPLNCRHTPQTATSADLTRGGCILQRGDENVKVTPRTATSADCGVVADKRGVTGEDKGFNEEELDFSDTKPEDWN
jgi:putative DNA primase/helicase